MPLFFTVKEVDIRGLVFELKKADDNLQSQLQKELRGALKPVNDSLKAGIPKTAPLSGFARGTGSEPYLFGAVSARVSTRFRIRRGKSMNTLLSLNFSDRRPAAGFSILELAGSANVGRDRNGLTNRGRAMIRNLNSRFPVQGGLGRFVIPPFKGKQPEVERMAIDILKKYAERVNRRLRGI
jgi:hypothetical protein